MPENPIDVESDPLPLQLDEFSGTCEVFTRLVGPISRDLAVRIERLISPITLRAIGLSKDPGAVVQAWVYALDRADSEDSAAWIFLLLYLRNAFDLKHKKRSSFERELGKHTTLKGSPLRLGATWFEVNRRLASRLYDLARISTALETNAASLREVIRILDFLMDRDIRAKERQIRQKYTGMRGVATGLLAKFELDKATWYLKAIADLKESRVLGNDNAASYQYLINAYLHLYDCTLSTTWLDEAERNCQEGIRRFGSGRVLSLQTGEIALRRGFELAERGTASEALCLFERAVDAFDASSSFPEVPQAPTAYLRMKRGHARLRTITTRHAAGIEPSSAGLIDLAIDDLRSGGNSLPSALLIRANERLNDDRFEESQADFEEAVEVSGRHLEDDETRTNHQRARAGLAGCLIGRGMRDRDEHLVRQGIELFLTVPVSVREVNLAAAFHGVRFVADSGVAGCESLIRSVADNTESRLRAGQFEGSSRRFCASHTAGLLYRMAQDSDDVDLLCRILRLEQDAIAAQIDPGAAELYSIAGSVALRVGKLAARSQSADSEEIAEAYLKDAVTYFELGLAQASAGNCSAAFSFTTANSKIGEACVRLSAELKDETIAAKAIHHLEESRRLGNESRELLGLLADAYYRRGRARRDESDLIKTAELKELARVGGHSSRENLSVSAAAMLRLWELTSASKDLALAIQHTSDAIALDGTWPWPYFQLAEIAQKPFAARAEGVRQLLTSHVPAVILNQIRSGDADQLYQSGVRLAVDSREFDREKLGGRQPVYVLDDPHRLLSMSFVFKETDSANAEREIAAISDFKAFLEATHAPADFLLPEPLLVLSMAGSTVTYVMRRARGRQLGSMVVDEDFRVSRLAGEAYRTVVRYLAYFHAWGKNTGFAARAGNPVASVLRQWEAIGISKQNLKELSSAMRLMLPRGLPALRKKDAHPENWLVDSQQHVVMLDLESSTSWPILYEVAQLLEDYPLVPVDESGWQARAGFIEEYVNTVRDLTGLDLFGSRDRNQIYSSFALIRAAFGLARIQNKRPGDTSSAISAARARTMHYQKLIRFMAERGPNDSIRRCASLLLGLVAEYVVPPADVDHAAA